MNEPVKLNRSLNLVQLVLYGLGTTIGAGIYALVGELAAIAGYYAPVSFLVASVMAALTGLSFAELSGRSLKAALKRADRAGARFVVLLGEEELAEQRATLRDLKSGDQQSIERSRLAAEVEERR